MKEFKIIIEGDPLSVNQSYATKRGKRTLYMTPKAKAYAQSTGYQAKVQRPKGSPFRQYLEVTYHYYFNSNRVRDHLNFNKCLNDSLNQIIWQDDKQIKISHHYTHIDKARPRIELFIKEKEE